MWDVFEFDNDNGCQSETTVKSVLGDGDDSLLLGVQDTDLDQQFTHTGLII